MTPSTELIPSESNVLVTPGLFVTRQDLERVSERIALLKEFVRAQLVRDIDYGIIPGTPKDCLYKPGAEKLKMLFQLTCKKELVFKEIDRKENFAVFSYRSDIFDRNGNLLAQCEGSANSQEKKWATRRSQGAKEVTPICDVLNTLQKMAQKRSFVGGIIEACGASDFFSQDIDDPEDAAANNVRPEPKRVAVQMPKATSAHRSDQSEVEACVCGNTMMISKYNQNEWYCNSKAGGCGAKKPRGVEVQ